MWRLRGTVLVSLLLALPSAGCLTPNYGSAPGITAGAMVGAAVGAAAAGGGVGFFKNNARWTRGVLIGGTAGATAGYAAGTGLFGLLKDLGRKSRDDGPRCEWEAEETDPDPVDHEDTSELEHAESLWARAEDEEDDLMAIFFYREGLRIAPHHPEPHHEMALRFLKLGDEAEARRAFRRALAVDPGHRASKRGLASLEDDD